MKTIYVVSNYTKFSKYYFNWFYGRYKKYIQKSIKSKCMLMLNNDIVLKFVILDKLPDGIRHSHRDQHFKEMCYLKEIEELNLLIQKIWDGYATMEDFEIANLK